MPLATLPNLGPVSERMLRRAGIATEAQLRAHGSVRAFVRVVASGARPSLNLLWALEGALTDRRWQAVAKNDRLSLLLQLEREARRSSTRSLKPRAKAARQKRRRAARK